MNTSSATSAPLPDPSAMQASQAQITEQPSAAKTTIVSHDKAGVKPTSPELLEKADAQKSAIATDIPPSSATPAPHDPLPIGPALNKSTEKKVGSQRLAREAPSAAFKLEAKETHKSREAQKAETLAKYRENILNPQMLRKLISRDPDLALDVMNEFDKNNSTPERTEAMKKFASEMCKTPEGRKFVSDFVCRIIKKDIADKQSTSDETQVLRKSEKTSQQLCTVFQNIMIGPLVDPIIEGKLKEIISQSGDFTKGDINVVTKHTDDILNSLTGALSGKNRIPPEMQAVYETIGQSVTSRFPKANPETHIASFLFLRKVNVGISGADQDINRNISPDKKNPVDLSGTDDKSKNARSLSIALQDVVNNYGSDPKSIKNKWDDALFKNNYIQKRQTTINSIGSFLLPKPESPLEKGKSVKFQS